MAPIAVLALTLGCEVHEGAGGATSSSSTGTSSCPGPPTGDFPIDVGTVIAAKCQTCHTEPKLNGAKFTLLTYEDTQQPFGTTGKLRWQRMAEVIEPTGIPHMPFTSTKLPDTPQLTDDELNILRAWFNACAPPVPEGKGLDAKNGG